MNIAIQLERLPRARYRVTFNSAELGIWKDPEHSAARVLLDRGLACREDTLLTCRGDKVCMRGSVGWYADHRVSDPDRGSPHIVKWRPNPFTELRRQLDEPTPDNARTTSAE